MTENKNNFDLEERTARFGENVIDFSKSIHENNITRSLINQLVSCVTSIGVNYMEANGAESKKDFKHKIALCKKESKEAMHWFRMIAKAVNGKEQECQKYRQEAHELTLISCNKKN